MIAGYWPLVFAMMVGHALCDFSLQSDFIAKGKNRNRPIDMASVPPGQKPQRIWFYCLLSHALIHGGAVWLLTGSVWLGAAETVVHWCIDFAKCENWTGIHSDQAMHAACKLIWAAL